MGVECWTIMLLVVVMAVIMIRRGESPAIGIATLPLAIVPFGYIISAPLARWLDVLFPSLSYALLRVAIVVLALAVSTVLYGGLASNFRKRARWMYLVLCSGFSAILSLVLLHSIAPF